MLATALAFASPAQIIGTGTCSSPLVIEARNALDQPTPVSTDLLVTLTASPMGLSVYAGAGCQGLPVTFNSMLAGSTQIVFSVRTATASPYSLLAFAPPLSSATQNLTVFQVPTQLLFTGNPPPPLRAGSCFQATLEARFLSVPLPVRSDTLVTMSTNITNGSLFFSDAMCSLQTMAVTIRSGNTTASVFVKPVSGVPQTLSATAPFATGTLMISPVAIVRRGTCQVRGSAETCPIDVGTVTNPVAATAGRSFLITQSISTPGTTTPLDVEARCRLAGTAISCNRRGTAMTSDALTHYQVVELPSGLVVHTATGNICPNTANLSGIVDPTRTFLLKSVVGTGTNFDQDDSVSVTLSGLATATLSSSACDGFDLQAVQWDGVSVTRGQLSPSAIPFGNFSSLVTMLASSSLSTMVLSQPSNDFTFPGGPPCGVLGRAEVTAPTELRFIRGAGRTNCNLSTLTRIVWERIDFGTRARVWQYTTTMTQNTQLFSVPITAVDPTRSFVITSSQQLGGQGSGESDGLNPGDAVDAAVQTKLVPSADPVSSNRVEVTRQAASSAAVITFYVVQIDP